MNERTEADRLAQSPSDREIAQMWHDAYVDAASGFLEEGAGARESLGSGLTDKSLVHVVTSSLMAYYLVCYAEIAEVEASAIDCIRLAGIGVDSQSLKVAAIVMVRNHVEADLNLSADHFLERATSSPQKTIGALRSTYERSSATKARR
jgi:hypothetical protein